MRKTSPNQMRNLETSWIPKSPTGEKRSIHVSARVTPSVREELDQRLKDLGMSSVGDLLEAIARDEIQLTRRAS